MKNFFRFRDTSIDSTFHPILVACRLLSALLHIHPFCDGNGRVSRIFTACYLINNGYPPILFLQPDSKELTDYIVQSQSSQSHSGLYTYVLVNIKEILITKTGLMG